MWKKAESTIQPNEMDNTSSSTVFYVRKNIVFVEATETKDAHWEWEEMIIPKEYYTAFMTQNEYNDKTEAQTLFTAIMTDTVIEEDADL